MAQRMQQRRGTAAAWTSANPVLLEGEIGLETDTMNYKIGDGITAWNTLSYKGLQPTMEGITYDAVPTDPSTPAAGHMQSYAFSSAGRLLPKIKGPSGLDTFMQTALFGNGIHFILPGSGTALTALGGPSMASVGTISHPVLTTSNLVTQTCRFVCTSAATANSVADLRTSLHRIWRGNSSGLGGFYHRTRFSVETAVTNQRLYVGLLNTTAALSTTQAPSALTNAIGMGYDSGDPNMYIIHNDGTGTATKIDLGSNFPTNDNSVMFDFNLFCPPNETFVNYSVKNLKTGHVVEGTITTDLPAESTFLCWRGYMNNGGTAAAVVLGISRMYIETDY